MNPLTSTDWRAGVLERFERWLREAPDSLADAVPEETPPPDLFSLYSELAALKQEVRMQARAAHSAARAAEASVEELRRVAATRGEDLERTTDGLRAMVPAARREARAAVLSELLKVRESLRHAAEAAEQRRLPARPWLRGAHGVMEQSARDLRVVLAEADDALRRLGVVPVAEIGGAFDPRTMRAVARGSGGPPGTVTEVLRQGFRSGDDVLQAADVVVAAGADGGE